MASDDLNKHFLLMSSYDQFVEDPFFDREDSHYPYQSEAFLNFIHPDEMDQPQPVEEDFKQALYSAAVDVQVQKRKKTVFQAVTHREQVSPKRIPISQPPPQTEEDSREEASEELSALSREKPEIIEHPSTNPSPNSKLKKKRTKDPLKNTKVHITKRVLKEYVNTKNIRIVLKFQRKLGITDSEAALQYCKKMTNNVTTLANVYDLMDSTLGDDTERLFKKAYIGFYRWFIKQRYSIYLFTIGRMPEGNKDGYLRDSICLSYLPETSPHGHSKVKKDRESRKTKKIDQQVKTNVDRQQSWQSVIDI